MSYRSKDIPSLLGVGEVSHLTVCEYNFKLLRGTCIESLPPTGCLPTIRSMFHALFKMGLR